MIAMLMILLGLSAGVNLLQIQMYRKKPKPRKQVGAAPAYKGLLGQKHILESIHMGDTSAGYRAWFYECSCGSTLARKSNTSEKDALAHWKEHVAVFQEFTAEGNEIKRLTEELETFKKNCICHNL